MKLTTSNTTAEYTKEDWHFTTRYYYGAQQNQPCLIEEFFKANPNAGVCMISCPCPKCRIYC